MLVLLIIFMISAPLLTVGVPIDLPKTEAGAVNDERQPLTISIKRDGSIFIQETPVSFDQLGARLTAMAGDGLDRPIYVRADGGANYASVAQVMARLSSSGFTKIDLITDTGGGPSPSAGPKTAPDPAAR